jgi:Na+/glutamate symporter
VVELTFITCGTIVGIVIGSVLMWWRNKKSKVEKFTSTNTARNAIALVRQFARENGHGEGGTMDQYLDRLEERAIASVA